ncbi:DUF2628 domain-containing protein [Clostridium paridis]|uniref:DUF2628 domain-containing protein n=1 Tax=Clostridium paridis TaxID=2803863 RepID=A0A937K208_9CLOT|nr:DUF2628 domain-containing protein [Clostridium paridis]MBL4930207.1 DUF2628 domain-containing protein [Clostridium paridis]
MICPKCGREYENSTECPYCASEMNTSNYSNNSYYASSEVTTEDLENYVGLKKADYFLTKWSDMDATASKISWNWPAFFINWVWLLYRKMYAFGFAVLGFNIISRMFIKSSGFSFILSVVEMIAGGLLGNWIYKYSAEKKIKEIKRLSNDEEVARRRISMAGGVNIAVPIIFGVLYGLVIIFLVLLAVAAFSARSTYNF